MLQNGKPRQKPKALPKAKPEIPLKNARHEAFVQIMLQGVRPGEAYRAAGYRPGNDEVARVEGFRLLRFPTVSRRLALLQTRAADDSVLTKAWLISEVRDTYAAAKSAGHHTAALKALAMLGLERGTFIPKTEHGRPGDFAGMTDEELDRYIADVDAQLNGEVIEGTPVKIEAPKVPNGSDQSSVH